MNTVNKRKTYDIYGRELTVIEVSNGILSFTLLPERSLDIGDIYYKDEKISWNRDKSFLKHPDSVDLKADGGFETGFYAAVTSLGPEVFGTPDEVRTPHGTAAYSKCKENTVEVYITDEQIKITAIVPIKGYEDTPIYEKTVEVVTTANSPYLERTETYKNLTNEPLPLDDAYHIQLNGDFLAEGGRYVLPVSEKRMFLRDQAPAELNPKAVYPYILPLDPIRCYQYIPETVHGTSSICEFSDSKIMNNYYGDITVEMLVNNEETKAAVIARPLSSFDKTLLAKRNIDGPMYAVEPSKTRPNSIAQKAIDGELKFIYPKDTKTTHLLIGFLDRPSSVKNLCDLVDAAGEYEKHLSEFYK